MEAEWECQREEEEYDNYCASTDCPPSSIVAVYTRINAHEADGEFVPSPLSPMSPSMSQNIRTALDRVTDSTPPLSKSVSSTIARTSSLAKSEKTKNLSNKSKERTLIAGTIGVVHANVGQNYLKRTFFK